MKKALKILLVLLLIGIAGFFYFRSSESMDLPSGTTGEHAEALTDKMLKACNAEAWSQTRFVQWTFAGRNSYVWDRTKGIVEVQSGSDRVILQTNNQLGLAYLDGQLIEGKETMALLESAWSNFCNDSFWLAAPFKVRDPGSTREYVNTDEGPALLVTYGSGGVTPGDSYLWYLGEDGLPYAYRMWTQILPIPGMKASWSNWKTIHTGAKIATEHSLGPMTVEISNLKTGSTLEELGLPQDYLN